MKTLLTNTKWEKRFSKSEGIKNETVPWRLYAALKSTACLYVQSLVLKVALLGGGGTSGRRGLVEDPSVIGDMHFKGTVEPSPFLSSSFAFWP